MNKFGLLTIALLGMPAWVCADQEIQLQMQLGTQVQGQNAQITLRIDNIGTATALELTPRMLHDDKTLMFPARQALYPKDVYEEILSAFFPSGNFINRYIPVEVGYSDASGFKTSTLHLAEFSHAAAPAPELSLTLEPVYLHKACSNKTLFINNPSSRDIGATISFHVAPVIAITPKSRNIKISSGGTERLVFSVCSKSRLEQGSFTYYAVATSETAAGTLSTMARSRLTLNQKSLMTRLFMEKSFIYSAILSAFGLLLILALAGLFQQHVVKSSNKQHGGSA